MDSSYRSEILPLDTPDDDPRWGEYLDVLSNGFLDGRASTKSVATYRNQRRADGAHLAMMTVEGPGLTHRQPVGVFASAPFTMNAGAGIVDCLVVNTIAVRSTHRRRGLLTTMMAEQLGAARQRGLGTAVLTASESTIYGRYGFGPCTRAADHEIDTKEFRLAAHAPVAPGRVELVQPGGLDELFTPLNLAFQERYRGAFGRQHGHWLTITGAWDRGDDGPSKSLRTLVHFDADDKADGYAVFRHKGWDGKDITVEVVEVCAVEPAVQFALWQSLASMDLVERLTLQEVCGLELAPALTDPWCVRVTKVSDKVWLRILDLPTAVAQRGFDHDGAAVVAISDPHGWNEGTWQISATDGVGRAERSDAPAELSLSIATLARLWFGDTSLIELARAGLVEGAPEAVRRTARLFATDESPVNLAQF